jgi:hypothetical protein
MASLRLPQRKVNYTGPKQVLILGAAGYSAAYAIERMLRGAQGITTPQLRTALSIVATETVFGKVLIDRSSMRLTTTADCV